jgi:hypothetical protein
MVMRYFGGGIGHLKNTPPQQVPGFDPIDPTSEEMAVEDEDEDLGSSSDVMNSCELVELEVNENDDDDNDDDNDSDNDNSDSDDGRHQTDEDDSEDEEGEGEDDYGYASA